MPIIPQQETIVQYITNVSQFAYTFAFYAPLNTDIQVYYQASNVTPVPSADLLVLGVNYTVTFNSDPTTGGTITLLFTPTSGYYLTINRNVQASLTTNFAAAQTFNGANLDAALDRLLLLCQQNQNYALQRNLSYVINTYLPNAQPYTQLPPLLQNQVWIGSGSGVIAGTIASSPSASLLQSMLASNASGNDGARLVGYYDAYNNVATTVQAALASLIPAIPPGVIIDFAGITAKIPSGWLLCDGSAVSRTTYANLFTAIGTTWGVGDGSTTFNLPNLARRVTLGSGGTATSPAFTGTVTGSLGGEEVHTMTQAELVAHSHNYQLWANAAGMTYLSGGSYTPTLTSTPTSSTGSTTPFNVMQLGAVVTKIIKY